MSSISNIIQVCILEAVVCRECLYSSWLGTIELQSVKVLLVNFNKARVFKVFACEHNSSLSSTS